MDINVKKIALAVALVIVGSTVAHQLSSVGISRSTRLRTRSHVERRAENETYQPWIPRSPSPPQVPRWPNAVMSSDQIHSFH